MKYEEKKLEYSPAFKGPVENRCLTDVPFLAIFGVFMTCWFGVGIYALAFGDIEALSSPRDDESSENVLQTVKSTSGTVLGLTAVGAAMSLLYIFLLKWFALHFVILSVIIWCSLLCYLSYYYYTLYVEHNNGGWLSLTILFPLMAGGVVLIVICMFGKIRSACLLIKETSVAVTSILSSLLYSLFQWLLHFFAIIYVVTVLLCLSSFEDHGDAIRIFLLSIHLIGSIWLHCFITALGEMILAGTFATWYWTFRKSEVPLFTVATSAWRTIRYHLGTVAFGSLLITICRLIRYCWESMRHVMYVGDSEPCCALTCVIFCCLSCLIAALERFLNYMNQNAYIVCAVHGKGLCKSAFDAMSLIVRNALQVIVLNNVVSWVLWLGKISICALLGVITWVHYTSETYEIKNWWVPFILVVLGGYLVTTAFFSVYEVAVDTIFLCFLEDCERNDGSQEKPYYMSRQLRTLLYKDVVTETRSLVVQ